MCSYFPVVARWVIRKSLDRYDRPGVQVHLYWGRPVGGMNSTRWVWYDDVCPYVRVFGSLAEAERAAGATAGVGWRRPGVEAVRLLDYAAVLESGD